MPLIDQRILIAAPAEAVWPFLARPDLITKWHPGCKQISILTTRQSGQGTRRRCTDARGKTSVDEITAWLENLGYEYRMIDGPFRSYKARLRLQPIPEGTIVNWTVEYRPRGLFGGVRHLFGRRRRLERDMAEGLRQLRAQVERSGARLDPDRQARVAMRPAPGVEKRAELATSRPAPGTPAAGPTGATTAAAAVTQPVRVGPASESSPAGQAAKPTGPTGLIGPIEPTEPAEPTVIHQPFFPSGDTPEPSFLAKLIEKLPDLPPDRPGAPPADVPPKGAKDAKDKKRATGELPAVKASLIADDSTLADTKPRPPKGLRETATPSPAPPRPPEPEWDPTALTVPVDLVAPPAEIPPAGRTEPLLPESGKTDALQSTPIPPTLPELRPTPPSVTLPPLPRDLLEKAPPKAADVPPPTSLHDTGEISIWEVFGTPPPSKQTQADLEAIIASLQAPRAAPARSPQAPPAGDRVGGAAAPARRSAPGLRRKQRKPAARARTRQGKGHERGLRRLRARGRLLALSPRSLPK